MFRKGRREGFECFGCGLDTDRRSGGGDGGFNWKRRVRKMRHSGHCCAYTSAHRKTSVDMGHVTWPGSPSRVVFLKKRLHALSFICYTSHSAICYVHSIVQEYDSWFP